MRCNVAFNEICVVICYSYDYDALCGDLSNCGLAKWAVAVDPVKLNNYLSLFHLELSLNLKSKFA